MALLLSRKWCTIHAGVDLLHLPPARKSYTNSPFFRCCPAGAPRTVRDMLESRQGLCRDTTKRANTNWLRWGKAVQLAPSHFVALITTRSRSVFRRTYTTKSSRRRHKRQFSHHTSVSNSNHHRTHALHTCRKSRCFSVNAIEGISQLGRVGF